MGSLLIHAKEGRADVQTRVGGSNSALHERELFGSLDTTLEQRGEEKRVSHQDVRRRMWGRAKMAGEEKDEGKWSVPW